MNSQYATGISTVSFQLMSYNTISKTPNSCTV